MRKCKHFLYEESYGFLTLLESAKASPVQGEGDRRKAVVGLLQTCGFDENSKFAQTLNNPSDRRGIAKAIPWKKHLLAFMGGSHFRLRLKPELFHSA